MSESGKGETAAQRHAATCDLMGRPHTNPHAPAWRPARECDWNAPTNRAAIVRQKRTRVAA